MFIDSRLQVMVTSLRDRNTWNTYFQSEYWAIIEQWLNNYWTTELKDHWNKFLSWMILLQKETEFEFKCKIYNNCTINNTYTAQKRHSRGILHQAEGDCPDWVHSDQKMVLWTVRWEAGPHERQVQAPKTKLAQRGPSSSSPLRSDGTCDGQAGGWTSWEVSKDAQGRVRKHL